MAKHGKELSSDVKRSIVELIESGMRAREVAKILKINESTVSRVLKRLRERGDVENKKRSGRPSMVSARGDRILGRIVKTHRRATLKDITSEYNQETPVKVSTRTIRRKLRFLGYTNRSVRKAVTIRTVNKKKRLSWCRGKIHWTVANNWKHVMFSDEMMIVLKNDGKLRVWRKAPERWRPECLGHLTQGPQTPLKLMVWGCLTYNGVGTLAFVDGNMNSDKYIQTLDDNLWPAVVKRYGSERWIFQDDNAPCHRSRQSEAWKHTNQIPQLSWPPQSPDLSPIENIWLLMKNTIKNRLYLIQNVADLKTQLLRAWNEVPLHYIQRLYSSLPRRCRQVLIQKGAITKY